jgi:hypothetical protein
MADKIFVPAVTTSTLGDRLEALRTTQKDYEDQIPARIAPYLPEAADTSPVSEREFPNLPSGSQVKEDQ